MICALRTLGQVCEQVYAAHMPHVSKHQLTPHQLDELDRYLYTLLRDTGSRTRLNVMRELLTDTEKIMIAKRLGVLYLLSRNCSLYEVSELLNVSASTVKRIRCARDAGAFRHAAAWAHAQTPEGKLEESLKKLIRLVMTGHTRSLAKIIDEM